MFELKIFWRTLTRFAVCASKPWPVSSVCKKFRVQHRIGAEIYYSEKSPLGGVNMSVYNFLVSGPKFTKFFSPKRGWNVVEKVLFRFWICRPGDPWPGLRCAIASLRQTVARVKISVANTPNGWNIVCRKKSTSVGANSHVLLCG